ncbi:MAG: hypothetical protein JST30_02880 [Armatimonadetes bacterium]|nr:hypothetical protein [Armatimonadota bacterium]
MVSGVLFEFGVRRPVRWSLERGFLSLPLPKGAIEGAAGGANSLDDVLGWYSTASGVTVCVWSKGILYSLPAPQGIRPVTIDDRGWVVGNDKNDEVWVWTDWSRPPVKVTELLRPGTLASAPIVRAAAGSDNGHVLALYQVDGGRLLPCVLRPID